MLILDCNKGLWVSKFSLHFYSLDYSFSQLLHQLLELPLHLKLGPRTAHRASSLVVRSPSLWTAVLGPPMTTVGRAMLMRERGEAFTVCEEWTVVSPLF